MRLTLGIALNLLITCAGPANAVSVTNRDDEDYNLTVVEGDAKQNHVLKPAATLEAICLKGCVLRLSDSENDEYELEGTEVVSIENGYLYFDGPEVKSEPAPGDKPVPPPAGTPPAKSK